MDANAMTTKIDGRALLAYLEANNISQLFLPKQSPDVPQHRNMDNDNATQALGPIDLRKCVPEQKLIRRDGDVVPYEGLSGDPVYAHLVGHDCKQYTHDGRHILHDEDIVAIVPLEPSAPEPAAPPEHPSVAWWASCPVITDRRPEQCDGDAIGCVLEWTGNPVTGFCAEHWQEVARYGASWIHTASWRPPAPKSLRDQALEAAQRFYAKGHEGCTDEELTDDFHTIRRALKRLEELEVAND